jgi:hypothetical protein
VEGLFARFPRAACGRLRWPFVTDPGEYRDQLVSAFREAAERFQESADAAPASSRRRTRHDAYAVAFRAAAAMAEGQDPQGWLP